MDVVQIGQPLGLVRVDRDGTFEDSAHWSPDPLTSLRVENQVRNRLPGGLVTVFGTVGTNGQRRSCLLIGRVAEGTERVALHAYAVPEDAVRVGTFGALLVVADGRVVGVDEDAGQLLGCAPVELIGRPLGSVLGGTACAHLEQVLDRARADVVTADRVSFGGGARAVVAYTTGRDWTVVRIDIGVGGEQADTTVALVEAAAGQPVDPTAMALAVHIPTLVCRPGGGIVWANPLAGKLKPTLGGPALTAEVQDALFLLTETAVRVPGAVASAVVTSGSGPGYRFDAYNHMTTPGVHGVVITGWMRPPGEMHDDSGLRTWLPVVELDDRRRVVTLTPTAAELCAALTRREGEPVAVVLGLGADDAIVLHRQIDVGSGHVDVESRGSQLRRLRVHVEGGDGHVRLRLDDRTERHQLSQLTLDQIRLLTPIGEPEWTLSDTLRELEQFLVRFAGDDAQSRVVGGDTGDGAELARIVGREGPRSQRGTDAARAFRELSGERSVHFEWSQNGSVLVLMGSSADVFPVSWTAWMALAARVGEVAVRAAAARAETEQYVDELRQARSQLQRLADTDNARVQEVERQLEMIRTLVHDQLTPAAVFAASRFGRGEPERAEPYVRELLVGLEQMAGDLQSVSRGRPVTQREQLVRFLTRRESDTGLEIRLRLEPDRAELCAPERFDTVHAFVAEAVFNAYKHADASAVRVSVVADADADELFVEVIDDGRGIDLAVLNVREQQGHAGLAQSRTRAEQVGGSFGVERAESGGTRVWMRVPGGGRGS